MATTDPFEQAIADAFRDDVPPSLERRVRAQFPSRRLQVAVGLLGFVLMNHAAGNLLFPEWIADAIHGHYDGHLYREAGVAVFGVGVLMLLAAFRHRLLDAAAAVGVPVGLGFGAIGVWEANRSLFGATVHLSEAAAAIAVLVLWWKSRYAPRRRHEERT